MKIWLDDLRPAPHDYYECRSVNEAKETIRFAEKKGYKIEVIDCDHDLGDFAFDGGDGIKLLDWLESTFRNYPIRIHTMNPVGRQNMLAVIRKNNWLEVQ